MDNSDDNRLETVNVRLPDEVLKILDQLVKRGIFANRSEAIREFCREYVLEQDKLTTQHTAPAARRTHG